MKKMLLLVGFLLACMPLGASAPHDGDLLSLVDSVVADRPDCDTIVSYENFNLHVIRSNGDVIHSGLYLFDDKEKKSMGCDILNRVETELLKKCLRFDSDPESLVVVSGNLNDFGKISPDTPHLISNNNSRSLEVQWDVDGFVVKVQMPLGYLSVKEGSRSDVERDFIAGVKAFSKKRTPLFSVDFDKAQPYGEDKYIIPGTCYQNNEINSNIFLESDSLLNPVWDRDFPLESIANLFNCPSEKYAAIRIVVNVLKHEYGEKENFSVPLENFLAYCEKEGCTPFWGVEKFIDGKIEGALFLFNRNQGYDHVLKIECVPADLFDADGVVYARASLFVPTNNVNNLFQPYVRKSEKERIRYAK